MSPVNAEDLIAHLSGGLDPADRAKFRRAAENALATSPQCSGEGSAYRVIASLWRSYFHPPADTGNFGWDCGKKQPNKLIRDKSPPQGNRARNLRVVG